MKHTDWKYVEQILSGDSLLPGWSDIYSEIASKFESREEFYAFIIGLYKAIQQDHENDHKKTELCLKCGKAFIPRRKGQQFCPSEQPGKRSKCQNAYDQMKYKQRKAEIPTHG